VLDGHTDIVDDTPACLLLVLREQRRRKSLVRNVVAQASIVG
jgi:hypothetical protein